MTLHDLFVELEADVAALFARFRCHPAVVAAVEPAAPAAPVAEPPVAPVQPVAPVEPPPQVISDPAPVAPVAPAPSAGPVFNPHKTVLDASDIGGLFEPAFGMTTYTITGPLRVFLVIDGTEVLTEKASLSVDGSTPQDATVNGTIAMVGEGAHKAVVQHNVTTGRVRLQVQAA